MDIAILASNQNEATATLSKVFARLALLENRLSRFNPDSDIAKVNRAKRHATVPVSALTFRLLRRAANLQMKSGKLFRPWQQPLGLAKKNRVRILHGQAKVDLGGIAKGFAVDEAIRLLKRAGIGAALVNAGGDMRSFGPCDFPILIRDPQNPGKCLFGLKLNNQSLCNSGNYFAPGHIRGTRRNRLAVLAAGVMAPNCRDADALTKVLMLHGEKGFALLRSFGVSGYIIAKNKTVVFS